MGKKDRSPSSFLSEEDEKLWRKIASTTRPLSKKDRNRIENIELTVKPPVPRQTPELTRSQTSQAKQPVAKGVEPTVKQSPPLADIDRKKIRKLSTDQITIQATLDLHGHRREQAHSTLRSFIRGCQAQDFRYVLIITGKGATKKADQVDHWMDPEPGVLKRLVPQWLSDPDLREYIVGYTRAHVKHGGEGALYVQLRRQKKR